jgi:hypothetical protein
MALFIIIPAKESTPKTGIKPHGSLKINHPTTPPITANGIVNTTIIIFLKELNCIIRSKTIIRVIRRRGTIIRIRRRIGRIVQVLKRRITIIRIIMIIRQQCDC